MIVLSGQCVGPDLREGAAVNYLSMAQHKLRKALIAIMRCKSIRERHSSCASGPARGGKDRTRQATDFDDDPPDPGRRHHGPGLGVKHVLKRFVNVKGD